MIQKKQKQKQNATEREKDSIRKHKGAAKTWWHGSCHCNNFEI